MLEPSELRLRLHPDPTLRVRAKAVEVVDDRIRSLAERMIEVMREATRIGHLDHADPDWPAAFVRNPALACGFASPSHFSKCYRAHYETTPYRERGALARPAAG